ncbi:hypothetical protein [Pseudoalteromonas byunsanensis]|uniref:Uncharacterized protein n=1 Tax=Pseudoalteromonas byunsanensis TaxID=327939 RepID=A0A1S1NB85_9GAMM|nr:hypothetical protein [Pseudoalteromonas byunsanensis]OHU97339.1 hypothetical protein BIW53_03180 [Pseudoalteromonas byunsanensis]
MHAKENPIKMVALKLTTLNWMDRAWLLRRLDPEVRKQVKGAYSALQQIGIENPSELLAQLTGNKHQLEHQASPLPKDVLAYLKRIDTHEGVVTEQVKALINEHLHAAKHTNVVELKEGGQ